MYINTVQLASCHLHGDTCNKNNIDKIDITLLCFLYCENQHIHLKRHDRDPNSIPHTKHRAAWACIIFMSFLHWDLKSLIALSENLFIEKSLAVIQTYNRFFQSGSFTGKTYHYLTFSKAEKIML